MNSNILSLEKLELRSATAEMVTYRGRKALRLVESISENDEHALAILTGSELEDGMIEWVVAGDRVPGAAEGMRGFVGMAFRVQPKGAAFECFYLRPTNGRADDQVRRNHATQYISHPDYPWYKLRDE